MTVALDRPVGTRTRDPQELLNAVQPHVRHLTVNVLDGGMTLWDREIALPEFIRSASAFRPVVRRI
ncbi:hypothetical protein [Streptomyces sp. NBC_00459]|uniref:hypothetical protein n=1 Tax=Streptomyces sp. NBC_00459 TaxID=2975749 RepID=UPI002E178DAF